MARAAAVYNGVRSGRSTFNMMSLRSCALTAAFALSALLGLAGAVFADPNDTSAGAVRAHADGDTSIIVEMPYTGDADNNNTARVQWKLCSDTDYATPPSNTIDAVHSLSPYQITITGLTANTCYTIKATYNDTVVSGTNPQTRKIFSTWDNTMLHNVNRFPSSTKWSGNWGTPTGQYGQIDCGTCHTESTSNIKLIKGPITAPSGSTFPGQTGGLTVTFQTTTGFGDDSDNHTTSTRVCEFCHSLTNHHRYNTSGQTDGKTHNNQLDCTACHPHALGFYPVNGSCNSCHGNPPTTATYGGPTGLVGNFGSGDTGILGSSNPPSSIGAHNAHVNTRGMACDVCHKGSTMPSTDSKLEMGFWIDSTTFPGWGPAAITTGTMNLQTPNASFQYQAYAGTTVNSVSDYSNTCSNLYCHGSSLTGGSNNAPSWTGTNQAACGTCHGASTSTPPTSYPTAGSHTTHAGTLGLGCATCHPSVTDNSHVKGIVSWQLDTTNVRLGTNATYSSAPTGSTGNLAPSASYESCANLYCHSSVQGTNGVGVGTSVSVQWGNTASVNCGSCHKNMATDSSAPGSHVKHAQTYAFSCSTCHTGAGSGTSKHADHTIDVSIDTNYGIASYSGGTTAGNNAPGGGYGNCSSVYCHSDGLATPVTYTTPAWGGTAVCGSCHGASAAAPPASAPHAKHVGSSAGYQFACVKCHSATVDTSAADSTTTPNINYAGRKHVDKLVEVAFDGYAGSGAIESGSQQCSNIYCHGNGQNLNPTNGPISWSLPLPSGPCASCHGNTSALLTSGSHSWHIQYTDSSNGRNPITCNNCHNATAASNTALSSSTGTVNHVNKFVTINLNSLSSGATATYNGQTAGGATVYQKGVATGAGTCNTTYCHSRQSSTWGNNTTYSTCVKCHGVPATSSAGYTANNNLAAPGYIASGTTNTGVNTSDIYGALTGTGNVSNDSKVGAHDSHLSARYGLANPIQCTDCHPSRTSPTDSGHMSGTTQFLWSSLSNSSGSMSPNYSSGQCSATYCHGGGLGAGVTGSAPTPTWTNTTYLNGNRSHDCNQCHVSPPTSTAKYDHSMYSINTDCSECHGHNGSGSTHINGTLDGRGACNACHWYDSTDVNAWAASGGTTTGVTSYGTYTIAGMVTQGTASYSLVNTTTAWGAHVKHINHLKTVNSQVLSGPVDTFGGATFNNVCGVCHTHLGTNHLNTTREINFADGSTAYSFDGISAPTYSSTTGVCSNVSCHFQGSPAW